MSRLAAHRNHFHLATALITYVREGDTPKQRHMNVVMQHPEKNITSNAIDQSRLVLVQRLYQESEVQVQDIKDFVFLGFTYLGHMTDKEFADMGEDTSDNKPRAKIMPRNIYDA